MGILCETCETSSHYSLVADKWVFSKTVRMYTRGVKMTNQKTLEERLTQKNLQNALEKDESLMEYTKGYIGPGGAGVVAAFGLIGEAITSLFRQWYYVGLTDKRLLMIPKGRRGKTTSYPLADVLSLTYTRKGGWISSTTVPGILRVQVHDEALSIKAKGKR